MALSLLKRLFLRLAPGQGAVWDGAAGAAVMLIGRDGRIEAVSDGAAQLAGRPTRALIGEAFERLFRAEDRGGALRALSLGGAGARARARFAEGGEVDILARARPDGKCSALLVERALDDGAARGGDAGEDVRATADLLADLSHEMRTPLNAVIGFADAMQKETFGPLGHDRYAEYAGHIRTSGAHLLDLVSQILDLAKIEADRFALKRELVDAGAIARECAGMVRLQAEHAGLKLNVRVADDLPESALDPRALRQILINLLSNAIKFTSDGEVTLEATAQGGEIVFTVTDTGVGMSEADLKKLGSRFTAAQGLGVRGAKGAGLGLALAYALAELHGGSMRIESAPGEGVKATVRLPVAPPARPERRRRLETVLAASGETAPPPAILTQLDRIEAYRRERAKSAA